jgi:hypothetical protein
MKDRLAELHAALGHKPLSRAWAKAEIVLGLTAAGAGLLLGNWALAHEPVADGVPHAAAGLGLFVLGGYLAMAGHRSHLYQSNNELTAYLAAEFHRSKDKG